MHKSILSHHQVLQILKRIAFEIYENNFEEPHIAIVGICDNGYKLAEIISSELQKIAADKQIHLIRLDIDKENPADSEVNISAGEGELKNIAAVLVDDVLNTGKTTAYSLRALLDEEVKKLQIAVLVNRSHNLFPLSATYSGYEVSTTLDEHIQVSLNENPGVYLK